MLARCEEDLLMKEALLLATDAELATAQGVRATREVCRRISPMGEAMVICCYDIIPLGDFGSQTDKERTCYLHYILAQCATV